MSTALRRLAVASMCAASALACEAPARPEPAHSLRHPLALQQPPQPAGSGLPVLREQERLRRSPGSSQAWVRLGEAWIAAAREMADPGLYHGAADCADAALELTPADPQALALRAMVSLEAHRFDEARRLGEELLQGNPRQPVALGLLSDALLELGRFEEAVDAAQRMVDLKPGLPSYARAAWLRWLRGDVDGALEAARLAIDAGGSREPRAWLMVQVALMRWNRGEVEAADAEVDRALAELPHYPPALAAKGRVALARAHFSESVRWLEEAQERSPLVETAWLLGDARSALGDTQGAEQAWAEAIRTGRALDRRTLALFYATRDRDHREALRLAEEERRVRGDLYTEDVYAWALYRVGRIAEARQASARATRLGTPDARLLYHAGAIEVAAGRVREGRALVRAALALNPHFDRSAAVEARRLLAQRPPARSVQRAAQ